MMYLAAFFTVARLYRIIILTLRPPFLPLADFRSSWPAHPRKISDSPSSSRTTPNAPETYFAGWGMVDETRAKFEWDA
ncbi:hypothetical protein C8R45DRAFT_1090872 [Mycena sanguinolenta]|nr:hypothetical protein C8R45DRAFT_1090872 [Mycena sanguinolenta]